MIGKIDKAEMPRERIEMNGRMLGLMTQAL